ncbi:hypothetical protein FQN50_007312 [Emmonsiellopsis sp. PD_5]|nr:hypothetical protein FQN50_007312 [Emmonsiellopsis sp. PD_5]
MTTFWLLAATSLMSTTRRIFLCVLQISRPILSNKLAVLVRSSVFCPDKSALLLRLTTRLRRGQMPNPEQKASFFGTASPRNVSRSTTPQPKGAEVEGGKTALQRLRGDDHTVSHVRRISSTRYPNDCPRLKTRWFYAVDIAKSKPSFWGQETTPYKPQGPPKKFVPFSTRDSQAVEAAFQNLADREDSRDSPGTRDTTSTSEPVKVPVNEDYLFDVDIQKRELAPAYWIGPIYEVRRGTWFYQEGSTLRPCDENLATQLEEGYLKVQPWKFPRSRATSTSTPRSQTLSDESGKSAPSTPKLGPTHISGTGISPPTSSTTSTNQTYRLFGTYMNSTAAYQDATTAWLTYDDFMSRMGHTVYQRLGGVAGTKLVRGYSESVKPIESSEGKSTDVASEAQNKAKKRQSAPAGSLSSPGLGGEHQQEEGAVLQRQRSPLERQLSSLTGEPQDDVELNEEARKQEEKEMEDSGEVEGEDREREIEHLILVTHGIGQRLGLRLDSINFVHDVNVLRKNLKSVYAASPDLQALNSEAGAELKNCPVQVLPVCWRHLLDFPKQGLKQHRREMDLADADKAAAEDVHYPSLEDITLEGVPAARNLITDLAMDVLLYQSAYREHIAGIVQQECNRIYKLFKDRNPKFRGSISLCGHSLGSAILFDILCLQPEDSVQSKSSKGGHKTTPSNGRELQPFHLDFECANFFCLGSPIALFQMLKGKTIAGRDRRSSQFQFAQGSKGGNPRATFISSNISSETSSMDRGESFGCSSTVSSPRCDQLFNIFHPSDPISYRLEPLISPAMAALKPQPLPFVKRTIWSTSGQSLTNISTRVGQSVGSLWSNFASGVASSLLNRSLGLNDGTKSHAGADEKQKTGGDPGGEVPTAGQAGAIDMGMLDAGGRSQKYPTLIDEHIETLYDGFQKSRGDPSIDTNGGHEPSDEEVEAESRARKLKNEEAKVRALNSNGRVDYSIQEYVNSDVYCVSSYIYAHD